MITEAMVEAVERSIYRGLIPQECYSDEMERQQLIADKIHENLGRELQRLLFVAWLKNS